MLFPFFAALLALGASRPAIAQASEGASLYQGCLAELRLLSPSSMTSAAAGDLAAGSYCIGYLNGFLANVSVATPVCTGDRPMVALVQAYVSFMTRNPALLHKDKRIGVEQALQAAFPCHAAPQSTGPSTARQHL